MKKFICFFISILMIAAATGCAKQKETLSFEEMMAISDGGVINGCRFVIYDDLQDLISEYSRRNIDMSLVTVSVQDVSHYLNWNSETAKMDVGYTETKIRIDAIDAQYNGLSLSIGDTVVIRQDYFFEFKEMDSFVSYVAEKKDKKINSFEKLRTTDSFTIKMELYKNEKYLKFFSENSLPLKQGETYSMVLRSAAEIDEKCYFGNFIAPISMKVSLESLEESYGLCFSDDYKPIAAEIKERFEN